MKYFVKHMCVPNCSEVGIHVSLRSRDFAFLKILRSNISSIIPESRPESLIPLNFFLKICARDIYIWELAPRRLFFINLRRLLHCIG